MSSLIEISDLTKKYIYDDNVTYALDEVNLCIKKQDMLAIMGPSGAGKSTLLNILGCLDKASSGSYLLDGKSIDTFSKKQLARIRNEKIGFVFQRFALIPEYTVFENLELPLLYKNSFNSFRMRIKKSERIKRVHEVLESVGISNLMYKKPGQLSGGQQQRAAIARALITSPDIILADEPTGALDQKTGREIMKLLKDINKNGKTIIIVTHDPNVASCCDNTFNVVDGKLINGSVQYIK